MVIDGNNEVTTILTTQETYKLLTEVHGISRELCKHCMNRDVEVYQCGVDSDEDWASCYSCWNTLCEPKIEVRD